MLRAIIFDFNGVILNDEPIHFRSMREAVAELGIAMGEEDYWGKYLPLDDVSCLQAVCADHGVHLTSTQRRAVLNRKSELYRQFLQGKFPLFPGAAQFVRAAAGSYPLALASGARRDEIEETLAATGLNHCFRVVVAAEDFNPSKPHPESYLLALAKLNASLDGKSSPIRPAESLVVEDSLGGVSGARAAGMMCMAVANTYPRAELCAANLVVSSLEEVSVDQLPDLLEEQP